MGRIQSDVGLITGINITDTVNKLMAINGQPRDRLVTRTDALKKTQVAYTELTALVIGVQLATTQLGKTDNFSTLKVTSSKKDIIDASVSGTPAVGKTRITSVRLAQSQQLTSSAIASKTSPIGAGELIVRTGGFIDRTTSLDDLNGGTGVERGLFRITDRSGASSEIDIRFANDIRDVLQAINGNRNVRVQASIQGDRIVLKDLTGQSTSNLKVEELGTGSVATTLGLVGIDAASSSATGTDIQNISASTKLSKLLDGRGLKFQDGNDFRVTLKDGSTVDVNLTLNPESATVGNLLSALNTAGTGKFTAAIAADGDRLQITDITGGGGNLTVADLGSGKSAAQFGLTDTTAGTSLSGDRLLAGLDSPLLSSLKGGDGTGDLGVLTVTNRNGTTTNINLAAAETVGDVMRLINGSSAGVTAVLNSSRTGILLRDTTGQTTSNLIVANGDGTNTATKLGLVNNSSASQVNSGSLDLQWISSSTKLSSLNQGRGIQRGSFTITDTNGQRSAINLAAIEAETVGDVIEAINDLNIGVEARLSSKGDGIQLIDTAGGAGNLTVTESGSGTAAADLKLLGTGISTTENSQTFKMIDGSQNLKVTTDSDDSLNDLIEKLNAARSPLSATTLSVGAGGSRLVLNSKASGFSSRFQIDSTISGLSFSETSQASDALIAVGASDTSGGILLNSSSNSFDGSITGINLTINDTSETAVEINVSNDDTGISKSLDLMVTQFNKVVDRIKSVASYDSVTNVSGLLYGDSEVLRIQSTFSTLFSSRVVTGSIRSIAELGINFNDQGRLEFDKSRFEKRLSDDPQAVRDFFSREKTGFSARAKKMIDSLSGENNSALINKNLALTSQIEQNNSRIEFLNDRLAKQRERLLSTFYKMEEAIQRIQSNQSAVNSLNNLLISNSNSK
jgi:flagellar hook-associated protein 2